MQRSIGLLCVVILMTLSSFGRAQEGTSAGNSFAPGGTGAGSFYQSQVYSGVGGTGQSGTYYVDPSRFTYNRPAARAGYGVQVTPGSTYKNYTIRPGNPYYYGYYPMWNGRPCYRYGPYLYCPQVYQVGRGVTEHLGPFVPLR